MRNEKDKLDRTYPKITPVPSTNEKNMGDVFANIWDGLPELSDKDIKELE